MHAVGQSGKSYPAKILREFREAPAALGIGATGQVLLDPAVFAQPWAARLRAPWTQSDPA